MASKTIKTILTMQDKNFSSTMQKGAKGVDGFNRQLKYGRNQINRFRKDAVNSFSRVAKSAIGLAGAYVGFRALATGMNNSVAAAKVQIEAETKLKTVLQQRTNATDEQIKSILNLTSAQQKLGVIGDEIQIAGAQQLSTFVSSTSSVETLIPAMNNLVAQQKGLNATQQDAVNIGNLMGKVLQGQTSALTRVGITFTEAEEKVLKFGSEEERAAMLAQVITNNVGEMNKALAETDDGKIQNMKNNFGDYQEEIGKKVLPMLARFAGWFNTKLPGIQSMTLNTIDKISAGVNGVVGFMDKMSAHPGVLWLKDVGLPGIVNGIKDGHERAKAIYGFIKGNWGKIEPIIVGIAGALTAYKIATMGVATAQKIQALWTNRAVIAQTLLNGAMAISPIGLVAIAIGAVVAIGWAMYRNWDSLSTKARSLGSTIINAFSPLGEFFSGLWGGIKTSSKGFINFFINGINTVIGGLNKVKVDIPDWVPKYGGNTFGVNIPKIPNFALGTQYFQGGLARINERGGEIVDLPSGAKVIPADKSQKIINNNNSAPQITIIVQGNVIGEESYIQRLADIFVRKLVLARQNM